MPEISPHKSIILVQIVTNGALICCCTHNIMPCLDAQRCCNLCAVLIFRRFGIFGSDTVFTHLNVHTHVHVSYTQMAGIVTAYLYNLIYISNLIACFLFMVFIRLMYHAMVIQNQYYQHLMIWSV